MILYFTSLVFIYLITTDLDILTTFIQFPIPLCLWQPHILSLILWDFCLFVYWNIIKLCYFKVHNRVIQYFSIFKNCLSEYLLENICLLKCEINPLIFILITDIFTGIFCYCYFLICFWGFFPLNSVLSFIEQFFFYNTFFSCGWLPVQLAILVIY